MRKLAIAATLLVGSGIAGTAAALPDPTQPPDRAPPPGPDAEAAPEAEAAEPPPVPMVQLQGERRRALIEGRWYPEGARYGELELRRVGARSVDFFHDGVTYTVPVVDHGVMLDRRRDGSGMGKGP